MRRGTAIDLFCGAGGLSEGFRQAGYAVLMGNDVDAAAGMTFKANHPDAGFICSPIQNLDVDGLCNLGQGELDVLLGGPPCQAYSVYNHQRGMHDVRANLFLEYLRIVEGLRPKWVVMENVTGISSIAGGSVVQSIKAQLGHLGYEVDCQILKAEEYGVPQERRRLVFVGNRLGLPVAFPRPAHGGEGPGLAACTTIWDAIGDLPPLRNGERAVAPMYLHPPAHAFQRYARASWDGPIQNHEAPRLAGINEQRMRHIPIGGSWRDIPHDLLPEGMKRARRCDHTKRYGRMRPDGLSCTILTKCDVHWGAYIHPFQDRAISVREAARLQSFPDHFLFHGSRTEQYVQVGNAVPPLLAYRLAEAIMMVEEEARRLPLAVSA